MKKGKLLYIIFIIIIIILLLLLITQCNDKKNKFNKTGNVDIFEINCEKKDKCEIDKNVSKDNNDKEELNIKNKEDITISDNDIIWKQTNKLNIFENSMYEMDNKLAPTSTNTYEFKIKNNTNYNINYSISFMEDNKYNIDMRYRLKKGNKDITDNWVTYNELNLNNVKLKSNSEDTYYLDWKWFEGTNDTYAGEHSGEGYTLSIIIDAYETDW